MSSLERHDDYDGPALDEAEFPGEPIDRIRGWLAEAEATGMPDPNAMVLSTVDPDGAPSSRTVLLKAIEGGRLEFVTNAGSRKGRALAHESRVGLLFPWYPLRRQVVIQGTAAPAPEAISDAYWASRPRGSQLGAWASEQSQPIGSREDLDRRVAEAEARFAGQHAIPRPDGWGAWLVEPHRIEFWQGRPSRVHDRILLSRDEGAPAGWRVERLQP
ncbi:pyridoxamine 5'-phosphate oxidase [Homoserinibacter sp. YIM 151385]|uniref:pyridoxamine 5'-phosphate oxidase n=1 Tax=Homoserinibacter sp. YIM 151385 TaxID=2985506 RepID=UPI0022EFDB48|nr:pyridoxamine 5'-phosphate oxidase [Homoserinibacter sp. YIM 151385]WBU37913.1 pyridoxamine 5'-phosphate oxidase [Homoserinibacter sp. YIM 151385]